MQKLLEVRATVARCRCGHTERWEASRDSYYLIDPAKTVWMMTCGACGEWVDVELDE